ncbi:hypothetical protein P689_122139 [Candidatus Riesia pediculischaeffi PTSU]|uniref:Uncharacterized protein n=1 Tax=Candidatus Riesia pediculischaeffi PTSU TaxID=1401651 RepID=A0A0C1VJE7_9ENTR|nr:hypothetical protein P689_122139 [Candidatus Riesia pediculischaeffi PTSU]
MLNKLLSLESAKITHFKWFLCFLCEIKIKTFLKVQYHHF